jgi:hypothetical protein
MSRIIRVTEVCFLVVGQLISIRMKGVERCLDQR